MTRILVVDDEKDVKSLMQQKFSRKILKGEFDFSFAHNGKEALELMSQTSFDILITDIQMPDLDGISLLAHVCKIMPHTRSIVVSAYDDAYYTGQAREHGAVDFIPKPLDFKTLERSLEKCLSR